MTIPPYRLVDRLPSSGMLELRMVGGKLDRTIEATEAFALAVRGAVEGVSTRSGRIRFVRWLSEAARPRVEEKLASGGSGGSVTARTNLGVFWQPVRQSVVREDAYGHRVAVSSGDIVGGTWTHCGLRGAAL